MLRSTFFLLFMILSFTQYAQDWIWGQQFFPSYADRSVKMTSDSEGNSIICGTFKGGLQVWGQDSMFDVSRQNYYIAKADPDGNPLWAVQPITKLEDFGLVGTFYDIDTDNGGNIYIAGTFVDSIRIGDKQVFSVHADSMNNSQMYFAKLSPEGECIWLHNADSRQYSWCTDISHQNGRTYISGTFRDTITIAGKEFNSGENFATAFMAELDDQGEVLWLKRLPSISILEVDPTGRIHTLGIFSDSIRLEGVKVESEFRRNFYYAQWSSDGDLIVETINHAYVGTNENSDRITLNDLAFGPDGSVSITGSFKGGYLQMDNAVVATIGDKTQFVAQLDGNGNFDWVQEAGHIDGSWVIDPAIDVDQKGNIFFASCLENKSFIGGQEFFSKGGTDVSIAIFSPDGELLLARRYGDTSFDFGYGVNCHANDEVTFFGNFNNYIDFDQEIQLLALQTVDVFLVKASFASVTHTKEELQEAINTFPNPVQDYMVIESDVEVEEVRIVDMSGRVLHIMAARTSRINVEWTGLPRGVYQLQLLFDGGTLSKTIIKD